MSDYAKSLTCFGEATCAFLYRMGRYKEKYTITLHLLLLGYFLSWQIVDMQDSDL